ncbi:MAG: hypothetical protein P4L41_10310 [Flavipsychrobacter sp.]|nr:hypothetical protein [Flavipsychrobacter sp.]
MNKEVMESLFHWLEQIDNRFEDINVSISSIQRKQTEIENKLDILLKGNH